MTSVPSRPLAAEFFQVDPLACARALIGARLVWGRCAGIVVETEAYLTYDDEACHTFFRPSTRRFVEMNPAGTAYVYLNYGVHWMLNVLVKGAPREGFVLIRALEPTHGLHLMRKRRGLDGIRQLCSGPGKLTQALNIGVRHHEMDLCSDPQHAFTEGNPCEVVADGRIGISRAQEFPWRYTLRGSPFVSRAVKL